MKKIFILFTIAAITAGIYLYVHKPEYGKFESYQLTSHIIQTRIKIIDIRTEPEWKQTGIIPASYTITFYNEDGTYDIDAFLAKLDKVVKKDEKFALLCRVGKRSDQAAKILYHLGYRHVVNLKGGIVTAINNGIETIPYKDGQ